MNRNEQEELRHSKFMEELNAATTVKELPEKIVPSVVLTTLTSLASFKDERIEKEKLVEFVSFLTSDVVMIISEEFRTRIEKVLKENYPTKTDEEINNKINEIVTSKRLYNLIVEVNSYDRKYSELYYKEKTEEHEKNMVKIGSTRTVEDLPKVGLGDINKQIQKDLYFLFNKEQIKVEFTGSISKALLEGKDFNSETIFNSIKHLCESKPMTDEYNDKTLDEKIGYIIGILEPDFELKYIVEEVNAREDRIKTIYKLDHDDIMDQIKDATRISQMPTNLTISRITGYLSANSMIYPKGLVIQSREFLNIANLLLDGKKMSDEEIQNELKQICAKYYADNSEEAYDLLSGKLSDLPKTDYYVEEVKFGTQRQKEFISRGSSNVNVYFIPNPKSPVEGGRFYNCYINRASNLNLEEVLPLDLEEIVPPNMDIDAVEWYVQQKADPTFKTAGGIILNKDESIGGVNVFRPNDGKVGITPEEKSKYEKLESLSKKLKEITDISKKAKEEFMKSQEEYLKSQAIIDEQISTIQEAMNLLIDDKEKGLK